MTLREMRKSIEKSQADVAKEIGVSVAAVSLWESGNAKPKTELLLPLAKLYQRSAEEIVRAVLEDE